ncbi:uncharacterized protein LOC111808066 [Cucurbita pepo subsp. pepo]|uniref:uncharacterized protein LOC111808066 n=1 Tax=Cucurbita pepo subsp. pepo TaxID=3664 RepID=UPI000C9D92FF|nr:uncharacterized protein LOC111808066 [Cucurbita pepo subsp. pepo]
MGLGVRRNRRGSGTWRRIEAKQRVLLGVEMDCRICVAGGDLWVKVGGRGGVGIKGVGQMGGFSHESEHDLALMVSDFLENGSGGAESWCSSDSDSGVSDLTHLADKILFYKNPVSQYESDLLSVVHSLTLSMNEKDLNMNKSGSCNASCIRFVLVKLLRLYGYDAAVCTTRWQGAGKVPGGDHEYIDVVNYTSGSSERLIVDIDFRSHFEIARAVESYDQILNSLPVIYVGSLSRLKQFLQIMVEAGKSSLKLNSMPLPPWRSLAYLQAKWQSPCQRMVNPEEEQQLGSRDMLSHEQCIGHLKRLQSVLQSEMESDWFVRPVKGDMIVRKMKSERRRHSLLRAV